MIKEGNKTTIVKVGMKEVTREGFEYELTLNLEKDFEDYTSDIKNLISGWSYGRWSVQEGPTSNILVYSKRDHD
jgi:hypothetical protein